MAKKIKNSIYHGNLNNYARSLLVFRQGSPVLTQKFQVLSQIFFNSRSGPVKEIFKKKSTVVPQIFLHFCIRTVKNLW